MVDSCSRQCCFTTQPRYSISLELTETTLLLCRRCVLNSVKMAAHIQTGNASGVCARRSLHGLLWGCGLLLVMHCDRFAARIFGTWLVGRSARRGLPGMKAVSRAGRISRCLRSQRTIRRLRFSLRSQFWRAGGEADAHAHLDGSRGFSACAFKGPSKEILLLETSKARRIVHGLLLRLPRLGSVAALDFAAILVALNGHLGRPPLPSWLAT